MSRPIASAHVAVILGIMSVQVAGITPLPLGAARAYAQRPLQPSAAPAGKATGQSVPATVPVSTSPAKGMASDNVKYDAHMAAAKALAAAHDKPKAVAAYEKALLLAPDEKARDNALRELQSLNEWTDNEWVSPAVKQLQVVGPVLLIAVLVFFVLTLPRHLRRYLPALFSTSKHHVLIGPPDNEMASYFRELVRYAQHSIEDQQAIARCIHLRSTRTVAPTFQSTALIADLHLELPTELAGKWWSPIAARIAILMNPPDYEVELGTMRTDGTCGLTVRLSTRHSVLQHWHESCDDKQLPGTSADLAFKVVSSITTHVQRGSKHVS